MKKYIGYNKPVTYQLKLLKKILLSNTKLKKALELLEESGVNDYYIGAGAINQTVFNYYHNYPLDYGINDYDIVYYDKDTSYEAEDKVIKKITNLLKELNIDLDIKNQARVYLWYKEKFGHDITKSNSVEESINKWGTTLTCIGVRMQAGKLIIYTPYGLNDLFGMIVRPVKDNYIKKDYDIKCKKWKDKWPLLKVIPWEEQ